MSVKEIGKPTKMPASIAPIMRKPIISGLIAATSRRAPRGGS